MKRQIAILLLVMVAVATQAQLLPYPIDTINSTAVYRYPVEKSIGLYRISVNFGVTQEEIIRWNPQLASRGLRFDETILIPVKQVVVPPQRVVKEPELVVAPVAPVAVEQAVAVADVPAPAMIVADTVSSVTNFLLTERHDEMNIIRLAFLLPLQASVPKRDASMDRFYDFYAGALLAVNAAQKRDDSVEYRIYTYDIAKDDQAQRALMREGQLRGMDAIIGPTYPSQVNAAAEWALQDSVWTIIPFSSSIANISTNPYLMQFNPSSDMEAHVMAQYLAEKGDSINCVLVRAQEDDIPQSIRDLHEALATKRIPCTYTTIHDILVDSLAPALKDSVENIIVFNTEKYGNLIPVMPHLLPWVSAKHLTLYSRYSWQNEKIIMNQLYTSVFTPTDSVDSTYSAAFDTYFHHSLSSILPRYDLLGYDLTTQVIEMLTKDTITPYQGLQSTIRYERDSVGGGWKNKNIQVIRK